MLTSGKKGFEGAAVDLQDGKLPAVLRLRNRLRICRLDGVNGHQGHSRGGKAVILSDQMVKSKRLLANILNI